MLLDWRGRRVSKRGWLGGVAALVLVPASVLALLILRLDPNDYKGDLIAAVGTATGRRLELTGDLHLSRSLWPTLEAEGVTLSNLPGGSRPDMARAERIAVELSVPALLQHRVEVLQLTLIGPDILFEQVNGKPNWRFDLPLPAADDAASTGTGTPYRLGIRNVHVQNGMVTWRFPARTKVLGIRTMDVQHHSDGGQIDFGGTYVYSDNQPFRLTGSTLPTAGLAGPWSTRLDLSAFDTAASATGTMDTAGTYDMQLEATIGSLEKLNALLPAMALPAAHGIRLSSRLTSGHRPGDLPTVGASSLSFTDADLGDRLAGLKLGAVQVGVDRPGGTATIKGGGRYAGQGFTLGGTTGVPLHPDGPMSLPIDLKAVAAAPGDGRGSFGLKGRITLQTLNYQQLDATASLITPALASLRGVSSPALPALTEVDARAHLVLLPNATSVRFSAAKLSSRQGDLEGDGMLGLGPALVLSGKLRSGSMDLDAMLAAFGIDVSAPDPGRPAGTTVISDAPLAWHLLRGPMLDFGIGVARLRFMGETWNRVQLGLRLKDGRLEQGTLSMQEEAGPVLLAMTADASVAVVPVGLSIDAPSLPLSLVARYAALPGSVSGSAQVRAQLRGTGRSLHELAATLDGTASLAAVGGQMSNAAFIRLAAPSLAALGIEVPAQGETALRCLGVKASFQGGIGKLGPIAMETTYLVLAGEGTVDLGQERLTLNLKPLATVAGSRVEVPVVLEGPFRRLSGRLDADVFAKLGLMVDGLFGGDRPTACADAGLLPKLAR